jgi:hypothetical protein
MSAFHASRVCLFTVLGATAAIGVLTGSPAAAQSPPHVSWKIPKLNPLAPKPNGERSVTAQVIDPFGLLPGTSNARTKTASFGQPPVTSTLDKMTAGTKRMASQTADFLNPFNDGQKQPQVRQETATGSNSLFHQQANQRSGKPQPSKSWLPGWASGQGTETKPRTVNEFLAQPRNQP